jgi:hypothetical protein
MALIFLAFVVPLAIYCFILALLNRSRHPIMVSGVWDFVGVLFAASGFVLLGGPAILTGLHERWRLSWLLGQTRLLQGPDENWPLWVSLWVFYFVLIVSGSALVLWSRRNSTSIYNIEPVIFEEVLAEVLDRRGAEWTREGPHRIHILIRSAWNPGEGNGGWLASNQASQDAPVGTGTFRAEHLPEESQRLMPARSKFGLTSHAWAELDVNPFPLMRHVTLHWRADSGSVRIEVEAELARALAEVRTPRHPVGAWFLSLALALLFSSLFGLFALLVLRILNILG